MTLNKKSLTTKKCGCIAAFVSFKTNTISLLTEKKSPEQETIKLILSKSQRVDLMFDLYLN